ncbi:MAG: hypothetical protein QXI33_02650, partial [Candidatus Pacearchaeota archaeon]
RFGNALIDLDVSNFRADVKILNDRVNVKTYFKVNINFNKRKYELKKFESEIKTNYLALYRLANNITEIQRQSGNEICLTCIAEVLRENNARLYNEEFYENNRTSYTLIYNIFKESPLEGKTEVFSFAHKSYK